MNRAFAYDAIGQRDQAIADYSETLRLRPDYGDAYLNRGRVFAEKGQYDLAIADFSRSIGLMPKIPIGYRFRGGAYLLEKQYDLATADFSSAIRLTPDDLSLYRYRGFALTRQSRYDQAIDDYGRAVRLNSRDAVALNGRCWARAVRGTDLVGALKDCDRALRIDDTNAGVMDSRGFVLLRMSRFVKAIRQYDAAIAVSRNSASSFYGRGIARLRTGDVSGGNADIAIVEQIDSNVAKQFAEYGVMQRP